MVRTHEYLPCIPTLVFGFVVVVESVFNRDRLFRGRGRVKP